MQSGLIKLFLSHFFSLAAPCGRTRRLPLLCWKQIPGGLSERLFFHRQTGVRMDKGRTLPNGASRLLHAVCKTWPIRENSLHRYMQNPAHGTQENGVCPHRSFGSKTTLNTTGQATGHVCKKIPAVGEQPDGRECKPERSPRENADTYSITLRGLNMSRNRLSDSGFSSTNVSMCRIRFSANISSTAMSIPVSSTSPKS